jgi:pimeloyl-ACP methyl ester carboxylesterase
MRTGSSPATAFCLTPGVHLEVPVDIGAGSPVVILHGYAMRPATYGALAEILARRCRVLIPDLFAVRGRWRYREVVDALAATLDLMSLDQVTMIGHSFGGGIELGFAAGTPQRVTELIFSDTLAVSRQWGLADEALRHPVRLLNLATPTAVGAFAQTWFEHPRQLVEAGWWGFMSRRADDSEVVARAGIPAHVLWANRDSVLSRSDGERFARELDATFTVASGSADTPIDHDWMFQDPRHFVAHLDELGLKALAS